MNQFYNPIQNERSDLTLESLMKVGLVPMEIEEIEVEKVDTGEVIDGRFIIDNRTMINTHTFNKGFEK